MVSRLNRSRSCCGQVWREFRWANEDADSMVASLFQSFGLETHSGHVCYPAASSHCAILCNLGSSSCPLCGSHLHGSFL